MAPLRNRVVIVILSVILIVDDIHSTTVIQESIFNIGPRLFNHYQMEGTPAIPDNLLASPLGLSLGLGMIESIASPDLKQLILGEFFRWSGGEETFQSNLTALQKVLKRVYNSGDRKENSASKNLEEVTVIVQNAIFQEDGVQLQENFTRLAREEYQSQIIVFNRSLVPSDRQWYVNEWARNATRGLITSFPVPDNFKVLLANTIYFEGDWLEPFASEFTRKGIFKPTAEPMHQMNVTYLLGQLEELPYYEDDQLQMIRLAYVTKDRAQGDVSMFVLLPKAGKNLAEVINRVSFAKFQDLIKNKMTKETVNVKLPKVRLQHKINVKEAMEKYQDRKSRRWMRDTMAQNNSSAAAPLHKVDLVLTDLIQESVLEVNEKGTRATALTGGIISYDGFKKNFRCDRPYLMVIYDSRHDVVLFWAAVYKPGN